MATTIKGGCGFRSGKDNGNYYTRLYREYYKDPFLYFQLTNGKCSDRLWGSS